MKKNIFLFTALLFTTTVMYAQPPQQDGPPKPPSAEERLQHVTGKFEKELKLTATQKQKLQSAYKDFFTQMDKLRKKDGKPMPPPPPPPPVDKEAADKLVKQRDAQVKAALTATQYQQYVELEKTMRPPGPGGRPGPPPPQKP